MTRTGSEFNASTQTKTMNTRRYFRLLCLLIGFTVLHEPRNAPGQDPYIFVNEYTYDVKYLMTAENPTGLWHFDYVYGYQNWTVGQGGSSRGASCEGWGTNSYPTNFGQS